MHGRASFKICKYSDHDEGKTAGLISLQCYLAVVLGCCM